MVIENKSMVRYDRYSTGEEIHLASKGVDVGSIDAGDTEALVQFAKCIRNGPE